MKAAIKTLTILMSLALCGLLIARFIEITVPQSVLGYISRKVSSGDLFVCAESMKWSFPGRISINGLRILNRKKAEAKPFASAESVAVRLSLSRFPWNLKHLVKSVTVTRLKMPRLPDGYYIPDSVEFPGSANFKERNEPLEMDLPELSPFRLTLIEPDVLDLKARRVTVNEVVSHKNVLRFEGVRVVFPDRDANMEVNGRCELDVPGQRIVGSVHGQARQKNIRPMLQALDISNSYQFVDAFTGVTTPVDAGCRFEVNLRNSDLRIFLDLNPTGGAYRKVPLKSAQGNVDIRVFVRDCFQNAHISVGPVDARMADGTYMTGSVFYENTNDIGYVTFRSVHSTTSLSNALSVADVLNDGTLDCLQPEEGTDISLEGIMAVDPAHAATNRIDGSIAFSKGTFFGIPLRNASTEFHLRGEKVVFGNAKASMPHGGNITGGGIISFPGFRENAASFNVAVEGENVELGDVMSSIGVDSGDMVGKIAGTVEFGGPLTTDLVSRVNGRLSLSLKDGYLARLKLFAGLTDYLAKNVPGVSSLVDQSNAEIEAVISNGVITASKIQISGGVFSITGRGTYSIPEDRIDVTVRVGIFKRDSIIGKLANTITWTFSKLLMEFKVGGSINDPKWEYVSVIERLL